MLWKGFNHILKDLENFNHPISKLIRQVIFILSENYENEIEIMTKKNESNEIPVNNYHMNNIINMSHHLHTNFTNGAEQLDYIKESPITNEIEDENYLNYNPDFTLLTLPSSGNMFNAQNKYQETYQKIIEEVFYFSELFALTLIRFYLIKNSPPKKFLEIIKEKIKDIMIRKDLYRCIYKLKSKLIENKKERFSKYLMNFYDIKPNGLNISPYFSLDLKFKMSINKFLDHNLKNQTDNKIKIKNNKIPFMESILTLRQIKECDSILQKIDVIIALRESILKEVDYFWHNIPLKNKYKILDADNLLSIVIYIVIKSQMCEIIVELAVIDDLLDNKIKLSRKGYFFNLMKSSIEYIISHINNPQINQNIEEYENNLQDELNILDSNPSNILEEF